MRFENPAAAILLGISPVIIACTLTASILFGAKDIHWNTVWEAFVHFDKGNVNHQIVMHSRMPRAIGALLIGACLAVSGAVMQGVTRNDLASPSVMGVSDGSVFAITLCTVLNPGVSSLGMIFFSFLGSALAAGIVFGLASRLPGGLSPVRMAIFGTIAGTFLSSISAALAAYFQVSQTISFWYNARLLQLDPGLIKLAIPFAVVGLTIALFISRPITALSLGEEVAVSLGQRAVLAKAAAALSVVILTGISVALAGNIGFVGLIVPHMARFWAGTDYRRIIPCAGVLGGVFLALCDILGRFVNYPFETPVGVVTAMIGVPFFLRLVRQRGGRSHA